MKEYYKYFKNYIGLLVIFFALTIFNWIISFIQPIFLNKFIDALIAKDSKVHMFIIDIIVLGIFSIIIGYVLEQVSVYLINNISFKYILFIIEHYHKSVLEKANQFSPVYLSQRIKNDVAILIQFYIKDVLNLILNIICLFVSCFLLIHMETIFIYLILLFIPFYFLMYVLIKTPLYKASYNAKNTDDKFTETLTNQVSLIKLIKIKGTFINSSTHLKESFNTMYQAVKKYSIIAYLFSSIDNIITVCFQAIVFFILSNKVINNQLSVGNFILINTYFNFIMNSIKYFIDFYSTYQNMYVSKNRINEILDINLENNGYKVLDYIDSIQLKNLSFSYKDAIGKRKVLDNVNLSFSKNNLYVIKGRNGTGKSTLFNIILGLYIDSIDSGVITYNNYSISLLDMYKIRNEYIGFIEQNNISSNQTVFEYLLGNSNYHNYCREEVLGIFSKLIDKYDYGNFFKDDEFNLNNVMNKKVATLSGGQQQKIKIFRELIKCPEVMFFDEPTTALDQKSIHQFKSMINNIKKDKIILLISHNNFFDDITDEEILLD
ncbi:ATP-binding cassette domain-containing protein [Inconstantimicrobium porci]|uniref:ABC transporter ATP-binding protein n=1 Tax=Inconstantimicrobium porci TaxID=2652291 RepID=A0A7X2MZH8_9CLOT|nr:ABC transporter ATP-binding protein [Inconstantimicrobium porci]MDD6771825.1 ABC transporter ATP-binding protein [Inconstantimicrobium porci]MSR91972.1 ABC transporter ATP-binding protein [Inconstantimicrobium porci]